MLTVELSGAEQTRALGRAMGRLVPGGAVLTLSGALGAGKTTLVQGLAEGLGIPGAAGVRSPSFAIVRIHDQGRLPLVHVDLYRLGDVDELFDLGLEEWLDGRAILAVEWAERFTDGLPRATVHITLRYLDGGGRRALIDAHGDGGWLDEAVAGLEDAR